MELFRTYLSGKKMTQSLFSLLLTTSLALTACNSEEDSVDLPNGNKLSITVGLNLQSRAGLITGTTLDNGSEIGITLDDGANTDYDAVNNIKFTAAQGNNRQEWTSESPVILSGTTGTLYAYYPYKQGTNLSAIPVETTSQTDYLYATPVENVNESNASIPISMNHILSNVNVKIVGNNYAGEGNISAISIQSDGFATAGTFNAAQLIPAFTAFTGQGEAIEKTVTTTLGASAGTDLMVVPTGEAAPITFKATIDEVDYIVSSADVTLVNGNSYEYTLQVSSTYMGVDAATVKRWNYVTEDESLVVERYNPWDDLPNGVYAVGPQGEPVTYENADESCIAVALIVKDAPTPQRFWIEKYGEANVVSLEAAYKADDATNNTYKNVYWGMLNTDQTQILTYSEASSIAEYGYVPLSDDSYADDTEAYFGHHSTWSGDYALNDWNGKGNTVILMSAADTDSNINVGNMGTWCRKFNEISNSAENQGYYDWYIPSLGQLALINTYTGRGEDYGGELEKGINAMLEKIGGTKFDMTKSYWSSSEKSARDAWTMMFEYAYTGAISKNVPTITRFIRDF